MLDPRIHRNACIFLLRQNRRLNSLFNRDDCRPLTPPSPRIAPSRKRAGISQGEGVKRPCAILEVIQAHVVHSLSPFLFLRGEGGVRGLFGPPAAGTAAGF